MCTVTEVHDAALVETNRVMMRISDIEYSSLVEPILSGLRKSINTGRLRS